MGKHFVRTLGAATLIVGSLIVVAPQPASALRYFVHGNVNCKLMTGQAGFSPTLRLDVQQTVRARIKGTLGNCTDGHGNPGGETGIPGVRITGGTFKVISDYFGGDCSNITAPSITMQIWWTSNTGVKIRTTNVSWATPVDVQTEPYSYHFVGGTVETLGVAGSYFGATGAVSFISDNVNASLACAGGKLRGGFLLDPAGSSELTFESPPYIQTDGVNPDSAVLGAQNVDLDITGQDFAPGDTISFSGGGITVNSTNFVSDTEMQANISIDSDALAGMRDVTVTNSTLGSNTCTSCFMVAPIVSGASPATAGQGATNRNITITGDGFAPGAIAQIGTPGGGITTNYTQFVDANTVVANISVAPLAPLTTYDVTVQDPGFGVGTCSGCFSVNSGPTVTSTSPSSRGAGATNQVVAINGTGFANDSTVAFGGSGISISNTSYVSPTQLLATISIATGTPNGPRSVTVFNSDGGQGGCAACFAVNKGPTVNLWQIVQGTGRHSILRMDTRGRTNRDVYTTDIVITGSNFQPGISVTYPASLSTTLIVNSTTYVSTTKIKQNVTLDTDDFSQTQADPPDRTVVVTNPDGGMFSLPGAVILVG